MTDPPADPVGVYCSNGAWVPAWVYKRLTGQPGALDFYIWLNLHVVGEGGRGYKKNAEIAALKGVSERQIKRRIAELRAAGVVTVRRFAKGNGLLGQNVYVMIQHDPDVIVGPPDDPTPPPAETPSEGSKSGPTPPPAETSTRGHKAAPPEGSESGPSINPTTTTTHKNSGDSLRSSPSGPASPPPGGSQIALIPDEVLEGVVVDETANLPAVAAGPNAGVLTKKWGEWCEGRGVKLPDRIIKRYAKVIKEAIEDGFGQDVIGAALQSMARDRLFDRPELIKNHLVRVQAGAPLPPERVGHAEASRIRQAHDRGESPDQAAERMRAFLADVAPKEYRR